jgi:hypothetical protein
MKRIALAVAAALALAPAPAPAQEKPAAKPAPKLTAEQVLDRFVEATGGRDAYKKHTSLVIKADVEIVGQGVNGIMESYAVAPDRFASTVVIAGLGTIREVYDGTHGWESSALAGVRELSGVELALLRRQATFGADADWRRVWKSVELVGTQPLGDRTAYVVKLTPKDGEGHPVTNFYDAETFLLVRSETLFESESVTAPVVVLLSDYRDVGGVKLAFASEQQLPSFNLRVTATEATFDAKVDDAKFAKPTQP